MVIASLPGESQNQRINYIMQSRERVDAHSNLGAGLFVVAKELSLSESAQQYSADYSNHRTLLERYMEAIKEMQKVRAVANWMTENRPIWEWYDQVLQSQTNDRDDYRRGEYQSGRDRDNSHHDSGGNIYDHNNSDSDANGEMNYSDDSDFAGIPFRPGAVVVKGAGMSEVNGVYTSSERFDRVPKYTKTGLYKNQQTEFTLFRCILSDQSRRWYISIIPPNQKPGTNKDIDFYYARATGSFDERPNDRYWEPNTKDSGMAPAPTVEYRDEGFSNDNFPRVSSNDEHDHIIDDSNYDDEMDEPQS